LQSKDLVYQGLIPEPKGYQSSKEASDTPQMLFRSTKFGDKQDRPLTKGDGSWSYFGADLAYVSDKINRGFESLIMVLGADHIGYIERFKAGVEALSEGKVDCDIRVCQLVKYLEDGVPVSMSKRQGTFVSVGALIDEIGCDAFRFMMITKTNEMPLDIDIKKVQQQSKDNPVFYVNYAYARSQSILKKIEESFPDSAGIDSSDNVFLLIKKQEIALIRKFAQWPKVLEDSALSREPHRIVSYLQDLAVQFHSLWELCDEGISYRFVVKDNLSLTLARSLIARGAMSVIKSAFDIIGIVPMSHM
jgi:arginyl-tRNA synthetase